MSSPIDHYICHYVSPNGAHIAEHDWVDPESCFSGIANEPFAIWLDSADSNHPNAEYSFIAHQPYQTVIGYAWQAVDLFKTLSSELQKQATLWDTLDDSINAQLPPFRGGAAGFFSYDLAYGLEDLPPNEPPFAIDTLNLPAMAVGLYDCVLAFDHKARRCFIIATGLPETDDAKREQKAARSIAAWQKQLAQSARTLPPPAPAPALAQTLSSNFTRKQFCQSVQSVIDYILAGDIFQANLAQKFSARLNNSDSAFEFYRRLRCINPAPFSCFAQFEGWAIASASPERFLSARHNILETRPIKGTAPRGQTADEDLALANQLLASEKNRAENVMIVDLLRNDLAKNCADGSIKVSQLCILESFSNVHHLVSTIRGQLAKTCTPLDALRDSFPGGSITGAPKIRAMELIAQIEPERRGAAYGSIGYIGFDESMDSNITIRTALVKGQEISFHTGGGIVADSQPQTEYNETLNKAAGLMQALGIAHPLPCEFETDTRPNNLTQKSNTKPTFSPL